MSGPTLGPALLGCGAGLGAGRPSIKRQASHSGSKTLLCGMMLAFQKRKNNPNLRKSTVNHFNWFPPATSGFVISAREGTLRGPHE